MRLAKIIQADFRKSELTNLLAQHSKPMNGELMLFVNHGGNQLLFVHSLLTIDGREVVRSERLRLRRGTWNPLMLVNYAAEVGLHIDGLKRFESYYKKLSS